MTIEAYQSQQEPREQTVSVYPPKDVERDSATLENMVREFFFPWKTYIQTYKKHSVYPLG